MWTCPQEDDHPLSDAIEPVLLEKQIDGLFPQILSWALQIHRQHSKLLPRLWLQIDRQDAFPLATWRPCF